MQEQKPVEQGLPDGAEWVNVMLGLVEEKAERYVKSVWPVPLSPLCGGCEGAGPHPAAGQICGSARRA